MRIKRIHAETMQDALERVREEMGPDAVIVSTRPLGATAEDRRRGLRGVEIVAGVDEQPTSAVAQARTVAAAAGGSAVAPGAARAAYTLSMGGAPAAMSGVKARKVESVPAAATRTPEFPRLGRNGEPAGDELEQLVPALEALAARGGTAATPPPRLAGRAQEERQLLDLIRARHDEFLSLPPPALELPAVPAPRLPSPVAERVPAPRPAPEDGQRAAPPTIRSYIPSDLLARPAPMPMSPAPVSANTTVAEAAFDALVEAGLSERLAQQAIAAALSRLSGAAAGDRTRLMEIALASLVTGISMLDLSGPDLAGQTLLFVGPTGAGKTTALLKAAVTLRRDGADVAIIAADVSRIGAAEQLRRYGDVLRLPVTVAYGPEDVAEALAVAAAGTITLIDTPACALAGEGFGAEVSAIMTAAGTGVPVLTVAAGTSDADLRRLASAARGAAALAITKVDEVGSAAAVLNVIAALRLPALLLSTGRDVIGEMETVTPAEVAGAVLDDLAGIGVAA